VVIAVVGGLIAVGGAVAALNTSGTTADVWSEVAKAGVQVVVVGVAGGALTAVWKALTDRREEAAVTRGKIREEFADLVVLYNGVKSVRRALRSLGLDAKLHIDQDANRNKGDGYSTTLGGLSDLKAAGLSTELTREQAEGFREQMQILNELQLGYEAKQRQFEQANLLGDDRAEIAETLERIEKYLNGLVDLWEEHGWSIQEGTKLDAVSPHLQALFRKETFRPALTDPMNDITAIFNKHLFGAPAATDPLRQRGHLS